VIESVAGQMESQVKEKTYLEKQLGELRKQVEIKNNSEHNLNERLACVYKEKQEAEQKVKHFKLEFTALERDCHERVAVLQR